MPGFDGISDLLPNAVVPIQSGTYTPAITSTNNLSLITAKLANWSRVADVVTVAGSYTASVGASVAYGQALISLPVASNFAANTDCNGIASNEALAGSTPGTVEADATNDKAVSFTPATKSTTITVKYMFMYRVLYMTASTAIAPKDGYNNIDVEYISPQSNSLNIIGTVTTTDNLNAPNVVVNDEIFGVSWNGSTQVPTKNALYDVLAGSVQTWTPIISSGSNMSVFDIHIWMCDYYKLGPYVFFRIVASFTLGIAQDYFVYFTVPVPAIADEGHTNFFCELSDNGGVPVPAGGRWRTLGSTQIGVSKPGAALFNNGNGQFNIQGFYRVA